MKKEKTNAYFQCWVYMLCVCMGYDRKEDNRWNNLYQLLVCFILPLTGCQLWQILLWIKLLIVCNTNNPSEHESTAWPLQFWHSQEPLITLCLVLMYSSFVWSCLLLCGMNTEDTQSLWSAHPFTISTIPHSALCSFWVCNDLLESWKPDISCGMLSWVL